MTAEPLPDAALPESLNAIIAARATEVQMMKTSGCGAARW